VGIVAGVLYGIIHTVAESWQKHREIALKQEMVTRGMSAEEIEKVLRASSTTGAE
jgi:hypothetical protein